MASAPAAFSSNVSTPPGIDISDACLEYDGVPLFDSLSIRIPAGQWTCLLGTSGVGKTTLLRLIAGLEGGARGRVHCTDDMPLAGRIAYMAQQDLLLPWLTIVENVTLGARLRGERGNGIETRARDLLDRMGLGDYADARPDACSGGMRQRAALARTLIEDRPVVLMDEPFSSLDAITRLQLQELAARMLAGRTVMLVTHDPLEALRLGDLVHVMTGRPARIGAPIKPAGAAPRPASDPGLLAEQAKLLALLSDAASGGNGA